ncbi:MAG: coproporphyrinogen-III oxidase family protein [Spirochaetes bacterium]|nr:coproporphyrinogen-III oxidase family protein [Spirochaetota bacterium]
MAVSDPIRLSLYVHVPFCASKCLYCDFYSVPLGRGDAADGSAVPVIEQTIAQLDRFLAQAPAVRFETVYVGGGTPSVLPTALLGRLLGRLADLGPSEWTVEANPESLDRAFLDICGQAGVTRLSVGLQSMDDRLLAVLGRPGTAADNLRAIEFLGQAWNGDTSFDLIAGIPGQSREGMIADGETVVRTGSGHASLYSLTVEPDTPLAGFVRSGSVALNKRDHDDELWLEGRAALEGAGLHQYEVSNFARPGKECQHNLRYWRLEPYLGIGPGAVSTLPANLTKALTDIGEHAGVIRLSNPRDISTFLSRATGLAGTPWGIETEVVPASSFVLETLMMGLRLVDGICAESFRRRFGQDLDRLAPGVWERWVEQGLASSEAGTLRLTDRGLLLLDSLLGELAGALRADGLPAITVRWPD